MCGRYYRRSDKQRIAEAFKLGRLPESFELPPDWNIAPSTNQPVIRSDPETGEREMVLMRWGLIPAKIADPDAFKIFTTTNARAESILDKPIWKGPFTHSRCLIPLDGFYEWLQRPSLPQPPPIEPGEHGLFGDIPAPEKRTPKPKAGSRPVYKFEMPDGAPYALAGLFSEWRPRKGSPHPPLDTFSIVTTEANELMEPIHDRMPVILHPRDYDRWLTDYDESRPPVDLLRPYEADGMRMTPTNRLKLCVYAMCGVPSNVYAPLYKGSISYRNPRHDCVATHRTFASDVQVIARLTVPANLTKHNDLARYE